jgi:hypothetical protein
VLLTIVHQCHGAADIKNRRNFKIQISISLPIA